VRINNTATKPDTSAAGKPRLAIVAIQEQQIDRKKTSAAALPARRRLDDVERCRAIRAAPPA
jgi:hypothetical protein